MAPDTVSETPPERRSCQDRRSGAERRGRPPRADTPSTVKFEFRLTPEERDNLRQTAAKFGESASEFARLAIGDAIEQFKEERRVFQRRRTQRRIVVNAARKHHERTDTNPDLSTGPGPALENS